MEVDKSNLREVILNSVKQVNVAPEFFNQLNLSRRAFDKVEAERLLAEQGVRTPLSEVVFGRKISEAEAVLKRMRQKHGRVVVKPVADGSSHGLCVIDDDASLSRALDQLRSASACPHLVEEYIRGREITVGVIDTEQGTRALPASEVVLDQGRRFDYAGKYLGHGTKEITPANIPASLCSAVQNQAILAHKAVGCLGYSRTDMIVDGSKPVFLEINNLPGLTRASFIPQQLAAAGISMTDFLNRQIALAKNRYKKTTVRKRARKQNGARVS